MKCQVCKDAEPTWAWQPFGPGEKSEVFTSLGAHYRGFAAIKVCDKCKDQAQRGAPVEFEYKGVHYIGNTDDVKPVPPYVEDPLAFWEAAA